MNCSNIIMHLGLSNSGYKSAGTSQARDLWGNKEFDWKRQIGVLQWLQRQATALGLT